MRVLDAAGSKGQQLSEKATQHLLRSFSLRRRCWVAFSDSCCPLATHCARTLIIHVCFLALRLLTQNINWLLAVL